MLFLTPPFWLDFERANGERFTLGWNNVTCDLSKTDGTLWPFPYPLRLTAQEFFEKQMDMPYGHPVVCRRKLHGQIVIVLGKGCNFRCKYCMQAHTSVELPPDEKVMAFLSRLDTHVDAHPNVGSYLLYGGEPLIYWRALRRIVEHISARQKGADFGLITNGMLLDDEKTDFIIRHNISVSLSHDGPMQHLRGDDPLKPGTVTRRCIDRLLREHDGRFDINPVITTGTPGVDATYAWFENTLGIHTEDFAFPEAGPCTHMTAEGVSYELTSDELAAYSRDMLRLFMTKGIWPWQMHARRCMDLIRRIDLRIPVPDCRECNAESEWPNVMDLDGRILACQNALPDATIPGSERRNVRGMLGDGKALASPVMRTWKSYPQCAACVLLPMCRGGCSMQDKDVHDSTCAIRYHLYLPAFMYALYHVTEGGRLLNIRGAASSVDAVA